MHEYSLMQNVVASILEELKKTEGCPGGPKLEVVLKVGALAIHSEAATRQAFEVLAKGTPLENSHLNLIIEPSVLRCQKCGHQETLPLDAVDPHDPAPMAPCPRCGEVSLIHGSHGVEGIELRWD